MSQIAKKFIQANAVDQTKIRLSNNAYLKARNAADSADVNMFKVNASDRIEFASIPQVSSDPSSANDLVRKSYLDAVQQGLKPKQAVRAATTANITIATALNSGDIIDGVTLANGDRVLVKDQTASEFNGIYIVGASPSRALDFDSLSPIDEINGAYTFVQEGSANQGKAFVQSGAVAVLDTDPISFVFFNSAGTLIGQDGITISGSDVSVDHDGQGLMFSGVQLALELDGSTLSKSASGLKVANLGIDSAQLAANSVTTAKIANDAVDKDKIAADVAGSGLGQNVDGSLEVNVDASTIEINADALRVKDLGITSAKLAADSVITSKILDANVTAAKLASDSVITAKILDANVTNAKIATGIDAAKLADGSVSNAEFQYINSLTSNAQTQLDDKLETDLSNIGASILNVANGGTGAASLALNNVILGNGTSAVQVVAPGTSGNLLTSNGTTWQSVAPAAGYTDEQAQDAIGSILLDSATIDFTYDDGTPNITAIVIDASISAAKLAADSVVTAKILDANVTAAKLASDSVITAKILDANVTNAKIATGIDAAKLADGSVSNAEFQYINSLSSNAQDQLDAKLTNVLADSKIFVGSAGNLAVAQTMSGDATLSNAGALTIANLAVSSAKLAADSVITSKILDANVTAAKLASDSVITAKILDANVTAAKLAADSVTTVKILDANVTDAKIATGIDAAKLADGSVSNAEFQYINSLSSNAQDQLNARLRFAPAELLALNGTDITNQYKDLSYVAASVDSISLTPVGGIMQERGVDYSVSLTGGVAGVTRITFLNDLASGGQAELISGDKLQIQYARL